MSEVSATDRTVSPARPGGLAPHATAPVSAPTAPQPVSQTPAPAVQLAASLLRLMGNTTIEAVVIGRTPQGWPVVRSDAGTFLLAEALQLATNAKVVLQLLRSDTRLQAVLLRVDGQPVPTTPTVNLQPFGSGAPQAQTLATYPVPASGPPTIPPAHSVMPPIESPVLPSTNLEVPTLGTVLTALTVADLPEPGAPVHGLRPAGPLPTGTQLLVTVKAVTIPTAGLAAPSGSPIASNPVPAAAATATPVLPGMVLTAVVTARTVAGHTYLQSSIGPLVLPALERLPPGTEIQMQVESLRLPAPPAPAVAVDAEGPLDALLRLGRDWTGLREALAVLQEHDPTLVQKIHDTVLPQPNSRLAGAALLFLGALRGGDIAGWLGEPALQALDRLGRTDLAQRLGDDFRQLAALADERPGSDWRMLLLPILGGVDVRPALLFMRRRSGGDRDRQARRKDPTRFLLNLELAATGSLQLDGFVRDRRFDLVLRSRQELPGPWKHDLRGIWEEALAITGLTGHLAFQAGDDWPLFPIEELRRGEAGAALRI